VEWFDVRVAGQELCNAVHLMIGDAVEHGAGRGYDHAAENAGALNSARGGRDHGAARRNDLDAAAQQRRTGRGAARKDLEDRPVLVTPELTVNVGIAPLGQRLRLSSTTTSPGDSVGASICAT
jgi:hypothetical protein